MISCLKKSLEITENAEKFRKPHVQPLDLTPLSRLLISELPGCWSDDPGNHVRVVFALKVRIECSN